jgi:hypothetical protein
VKRSIFFFLILEILSVFYRREASQEPLNSLIKSTYGH